MRFEVTERAANFYKKELSLKEGDCLRLFVRGGEGFYLGIEKGECHPEDFQILLDEIIFFITSEDEWFYDEKVLDVLPVQEEVLLYS